MSKILSSVELSPTLNLSECVDGFWLYDETRGMNLSMRAKSPTDAFVEALTYYQNRLSRVETDYSTIKQQVSAFVSHFVEEDHE